MKLQHRSRPVYSASERQHRKIKIRCTATGCERTHVVSGAEGTDVRSKVEHAGWQLGNFKSHRQDGTEEHLGKCPVCIGLGK